MSRILRSLWLLPVLILGGCTTEPNPGGPSVAPQPVQAPPADSIPVMKPGSISEYRRAKLEKDKAEADAAAKKAAAETPNAPPAAPKNAPASPQ